MLFQNIIIVIIYEYSSSWCIILSHIKFLERSHGRRRQAFTFFSVAVVFCTRKGAFNSHISVFFNELSPNSMGH